MTHILIPREPSAALLRPFIGCNTQELHEAWAAMVRAAEVQNARAGAAPAAVAPALDVTLDEDQAGLLRDMLGDHAEYPEAITIRLMVGDGHSGHGLYVAQAEYQDEGAVLLASLPAPAAPQAPAAPSAIATQVIENLLQLARIVNTAVEDWGESFEDGSSEVTFHKEEADKLEGILEFFDSLPDAPPEEDVIESGPLRAARVLRSLAAPAAPAVDAETVKKAARYDWLRDFHNGPDGVQANLPHIAAGSDNDLVWALVGADADAGIDAALAAQAKEGGAA